MYGVERMLKNWTNVDINYPSSKGNRVALHLASIYGEFQDGIEDRIKMYYRFIY